MTGKQPDSQAGRQTVICVREELVIVGRERETPMMAGGERERHVTEGERQKQVTNRRETETGDRRREGETGDRGRREGETGDKEERDRDR